MSGLKTPNVLILGGGGILGEAWLSSVLAGLAESESFDARECDSYVGTSAGSIVAAMLCAGVDPLSRLGELPEQPPVADDRAPESSEIGWLRRAPAAFAGSVSGPVASIALRATAPGGSLVRRLALSRVPRGTRSLADLGRAIEESGASWDGRLQVSALELESGRRAMLDGSGEPEVTVADAVQASCAIPGVFAPLVFDGRSYVDGGAWSPTNMDRARVRRGSRVLCLNPTGSLRPKATSPVGALLAFSRAAAAIEAAALRHRGAEVRVVSPDDGSVTAFGRNLMNPKPRAKVIAAGLAQGRVLASS